MGISVFNSPLLFLFLLVTKLTFFNKLYYVVFVYSIYSRIQFEYKDKIILSDKVKHKCDD